MYLEKWDYMTQVEEHGSMRFAGFQYGFLKELGESKTTHCAF